MNTFYATIGSPDTMNHTGFENLRQLYQTAGQDDRKHDFWHFRGVNVPIDFDFETQIENITTAIEKNGSYQIRVSTTPDLNQKVEKVDREYEEDNKKYHETYTTLGGFKHGQFKETRTPKDYMAFGNYHLGVKNGVWLTIFDDDEVIHLNNYSLGNEVGKQYYAHTNDEENDFDHQRIKTEGREYEPIEKMKEIESAPHVSTKIAQVWAVEYLANKFKLQREFEADGVRFYMTLTLSK